MTNSPSRPHRLLIADPDPARRRKLLSDLPDVRGIEAASMSEAFDLAEAQQPDSIALAVDLSGDPGLAMFLRLVDALSVDFVMYGDRLRDRTPANLRKFVRFVSPASGAAKLLPQGPSAGPDNTAPRVVSSRTTPVIAATGGNTPELIVIGASTGGVSALETVLTAFPANCPPTLVVQHIRPGFIDGMIRRLDQKCQPRILAATDAMRPQAGQVCIASDTERHLELGPGTDLRCRLRHAPPRHGHRPSVDALFETAAGRRRVAAALLTGMGADGAEGMGRIRQAGGYTIAQNEATCVVYGMPRVAVESGAASAVLPLERIATALLKGVENSRSESAIGKAMAR